MLFKKVFRVKALFLDYLLAIGAICGTSGRINLPAPSPLLEYEIEGLNGRGSSSLSLYASPPA